MAQETPKSYTDLSTLIALSFDGYNPELGSDLEAERAMDNRILKMFRKGDRYDALLAKNGQIPEGPDIRRDLTLDLLTSNEVLSGWDNVVAILEMFSQFRSVIERWNPLKRHHNKRVQGISLDTGFGDGDEPRELVP